MNVIIHNGCTQGEALIPASKSHSIRALLIAALADGESIIANPLDSKDARSCIDTVRAFGARVEEIDGGALGYPRALRVRGVALPFKAPADVIDTGNSGTTLYLAASLAALSDGWTVFTGDEQIRSRPVENLLSALRDLGAEAFTTRDNGCAPFVVRGPLKGGVTEMECPTSQFLSSLMLAAPLAPAGTDFVIKVPLLYEQPYAEMTARWLEEQDIRFENKDWKELRIPGGQKYRPFSRPVPGDFSSATFFACAAAISGGSILLKDLDMDDSQGDKAVLPILEAMGCRIDYRTDGILVAGPEPGQLRAGEFDLNSIPDSLPALAVTAAFAAGETRLVNVPQARLKETDRIRCMAEELTKLGVNVVELPDGLIISGGTVNGGTVHGRHDHRIVMACSLAGLASREPVRVTGAEAASVTFPGFFDLLEACTRSATPGQRTVQIENEA